MVRTAVFFEKDKVIQQAFMGLNVFEKKLLIMAFRSVKLKTITTSTLVGVSIDNYLAKLTQVEREKFLDKGLKLFDWRLSYPDECSGMYGETNTHWITSMFFANTKTVLFLNFSQATIDNLDSLLEFEYRRVNPSEYFYNVGDYVVFNQQSSDDSLFKVESVSYDGRRIILSNKKRLTPLSEFKHRQISEFYPFDNIRHANNKEKELLTRLSN